jgi:hypothetical protein
LSDASRSDVRIVVVGLFSVVVVTWIYLFSGAMSHVHTSGGDPMQMQNSVGVGIAGIASLADQEGIKLINDRSNYKEWEFIFDPRRVPPLPNPLTGSPGTSAASMGSMPGQPIGTPAQQSTTGVVALDPFSGAGGLTAAPVGFGPTPQGPNGGPIVK